MKKVERVRMILYVIAIVCIAYFIAVAIYTGLTSKFHVIWLLIGAVLIVIGYLYGLQRRQIIHIPNGLLIAFGIIVVVFFVAFGTVEGVIIYHGNASPGPGAKYILVLGAQVKGTKITKPLRYRLDAAADYFMDNQDATIIVSGGQGTGEDITEAEAMKTYLITCGIPENQILTENKAVNTEENIAFSRALMDSDQDRAVVVTNAFHVYRSVCICRKQGMTQVQGLGAKSNPIMIPSYYLREGLAVLKYKICRQI